MKNKIYNISHICFLMLISCFLLGSCMSDTINLDPDKIQEEELDKIIYGVVISRRCSVG